MGAVAKTLGIGAGALVLGIAGLLAIGSGVEGEIEAQPLATNSAEVAKPTAAEAAPASFGYPVEACKATMALMNGHDPSIMDGRQLPDGLVHVSWRRPDDGKRWQARCEVLDNTHLRWAAFDAFGDGQQGRWRNEDTIEVSVEDGQLTINLNQSGAIKKRKSYSLSTLS